MAGPPRLLRFEATLAGVARAARTLRTLLDERGLTGRPRYSVELVFEEIASNIVLHGAPVSAVTTEVALGADEVVLTFDDDGVPFDPRATPDPTFPTRLADARPGGLGIMLVRRRACRMDYERTADHRNRLTVAIPIR